MLDMISLRWLALLPVSLLALTATVPAQEATSPVSRAEIVHVLNRITFGPRPGDVDAVEKIGPQLTEIYRNEVLRRKQRVAANTRAQDAAEKAASTPTSTVTTPPGSVDGMMTAPPVMTDPAASEQPAPKEDGRRERAAADNPDPMQTPPLYNSLEAVTQLENGTIVSFRRCWSISGRTTSTST
jgi:hypothetical protein